ncbi:MAG TPA: zf-HC2 domain-containing protein [Propionibacteriaceae bacterium]|nr:zf-HC2 domain-containing protein [Propionibacteriaceae bacterium]
MVVLTSPSGGAAAIFHPSLAELAEAAEGLLDRARLAEVQAHVAGCAGCRRSAAELQAVSAALTTAAAPAMPADVAARLDRVLAGETELRSLRPNRDEEPHPESGLSGSPARVADLGVHRRRRSSRRVVLPALAAAVAAAVVGFGAYVASATAGLNEPPVVAAVSSANLGAQAGVVQRNGLEPHWFSRAWQCARQVTDGRIVGLASSTVDGTPALLVYTRSGATTEVTVVTGCAIARPSAGPSALVSRR